MATAAMLDFQFMWIWPHSGVLIGQEIFFCTPGEYVSMSNGLFNFNFLALLLTEILGGSQIYVRGPCASLYSSEWKNFCTRGEYVIMSNGVFNFNFVALLLSDILGGPKFTLGGPTPPGRPLSVFCTKFGSNICYSHWDRHTCFKPSFDDVTRINFRFRHLVT